MPRGLRITLVILLVLGGLFVGADRLAVHFAEDRLADEVRAARSAEDVEVSIGGFPFLTQIAGRDLESVDITISGMTTNSGERTLEVRKFDVRARDIALNSSYSGGVAQEATGTAYLTYEDLSAAADEGVSLAYGGAAEGGASKVEVTGSVYVPLLDRTIERSTTSTISVENGDTIRLRADEVPGEGIPGVEELIREKIDYTRQINGLPSGVALTGIKATEDGVEVAFSGSRVSVTG
ncbi:LmeA family phospholipid-binding protein [Streptomyces chumphonensis]|uniref:LmeA family phospholipid-binding protein n=1 Tax=Streptomyces chumphonensis TaxID=1214925 RepID=UPI003D763E2A